MQDNLTKEDKLLLLFTKDFLSFTKNHDNVFYSKIISHFDNLDVNEISNFFDRDEWKPARFYAQNEFRHFQKFSENSLRKSLVLVKKYFNKKNHFYTQDGSLKLIKDNKLCLDILGDQFPNGLDFNINLDKGSKSFNELIAINNKRLSALISGIEYIVPLKNSYGELNSGTTEDWPNLIILSLNNPILLIQEQIIHEATHNKLNNVLETDTALSRKIQDQPSLFSPFNGSVRPFNKVLHGFLSYLNVYLFWKDFSQFSSENTINKETRIKRLKIVKDRLEKTYQQAPELFKNLLKHKVIKDLLISVDLPVMKFRVKKVLTFRKLPLWLNPIEKREIFVASLGTKISRISVPYNKSAQALQWFQNYGYAVCSTNGILTGQDSKINFSNTITEEIDLLDDRITTSEIFIYFGTSYQKTIQCFYLDKYNKAGKLLGIPSCCDYYFKKNWETALKKYSGDMLELFLEEKVKKCFLELPWHLNVFTLYLGNSLLWHFPCSSRNCVTKKIINKRIRQLSPFENITFIPQLSKGYLLFLNKKYIYISSNGKIIFGANENKEIINCILQKSNSKKDVVNYLNGLKVEYKLIIYS